MSTALAALIAPTSFASAQGYRDNPPGSAFQQRGIDENIYGQPYSPSNRRGYSPSRQYYGSPAYGSQGYYADDPQYRYYQRDGRYYRN
jgi:hypothetical protein